MTLSGGEVTTDGAADFDRFYRAVDRALVHRPTGTVLQVVGLVVEVGGIKAGVGELLRVVSTERTAELDLEVVGFRNGRLLATPLGPIAGVRPGARVQLASGGSHVGVGNAVLGRILDAFGRPMDRKPAPEVDDAYPLRTSPPDAMMRRAIEHVFATGTRAVDSLLTIGRGQRLGIFAGAGVGKTTLLGMICRYSTADVNVIGLIGERGREVNDFLRGPLGVDGLARSTVVVATSDQPPLVRVRAAETATAIAEYFRDQGKSVLLVMDSVTRYAMALREAALATGEPPATKGYPPSVFAAMPRLLERAGTSGGDGDITALYTVLVEGDDMSDPVADTVRSILDGHIVLQRALAERGHFPAIDVLGSISRLAPAVMSPEQMRAANALRQLMATYREAVDLIQVGAYVQGSDPRVDAAVRAAPVIERFLRQDEREYTPIEETLGYLQEISTLLPS